MKNLNPAATDFPVDPLQNLAGNLVLFFITVLESI
jgi:hypothetical protein